MRTALDDHQQRLLAKLGENDALLRAAEPDSHALGCVRWQLVRLLREYQLFKHRRIFDPAIRSGVTLARAQAETMKAECIAAGEAIARFVLTWSAVEGPVDWSAYRLAALDLHLAIRRHVVRERRGVIALLAMTRVAA